MCTRMRAASAHFRCVRASFDARTRALFNFFSLAAYSVRTPVLLRDLAPGVNCSYVSAAAPANNDNNATSAAAAVSHPLPPSAPLVASVRQPSGSYTGAHARTHAHARARAALALR
jgi:hypothetical protein